MTSSKELNNTVKLGVGFGVGVPILIVIVLFVYCCGLKRQRLRLFRRQRRNKISRSIEVVGTTLPTIHTLADNFPRSDSRPPTNSHPRSSSGPRSNKNTRTTNRPRTSTSYLGDPPGSIERDKPTLETTHLAHFGDVSETLLASLTNPIAVQAWLKETEPRGR